MIAYLSTSKLLFKEFNQNKITYCHWKSNEHLVPGLNGDTDLDVLVNSEDKNKTTKILEKIHFVRCISQFGSRYKGVEDWISVDEETGKMIHLHLHYRMITGHKGMKEYELPWTKLALKTKILDSNTNVYITEPNLEIVVLITRIGLKVSRKELKKAKKDKYKFKDDNKEEIKYLNKRIDLKIVKEILSNYYNNDESEYIINLIKKETITSKEIIKLYKITKNVFLPKNIIIRLDNLLKQYYYSFMIKLSNFMKNKFLWNTITRKKISEKGKMIVFIGQDGSGKSTVSKEIYKWLDWKIEAKRFYLGSGEFYNSKYKKISKRIGNTKNSFLKIIKGYCIIKDYVYLSKHTYRTLKKAKKYTEKGGIAIFDRFPQIQYFGINDGPKLKEFYLPKVKQNILRKIVIRNSKVEEKYLKKACSINPNVVIKLIISPEESLKRKPEENYEIVKRKHEIIKEMKFENSNVYNIDASQDYNDELIEVKNII